MATALSRDQLLQRTGRLSQIGGITPFTHADGKAKGVSTLRVRTAQGLEFWVLPDKGMDICEATFLGRSLSWHSPTGITHPAYYSSRGAEWLESFAGGLVCTCGLSTAGAASEDAGQKLGVHGSIGNTPAEQVNWTEKWDGEDCFLTISGKVREASVWGTNLLLERTITTSLQSSTITLHDSVENQGLADSPLMLLYHCNFGFPLLTERSRKIWLYWKEKLSGKDDWIERGDVDLVGHDWGSLLVQRVASTRPDLVRSVACGGAAVDRSYPWHPLAQVWQTPGEGERYMEEELTDEFGISHLVENGVPHPSIIVIADFSAISSCQ